MTSEWCWPWLKCREERAERDQGCLIIFWTRPASSWLQLHKTASTHTAGSWNIVHQCLTFRLAAWEVINSAECMSRVSWLVDVRTASNGLMQWSWQNIDCWLCRTLEDHDQDCDHDSGGWHRLGTPSHLHQSSIQMFLWRDQELQLFVCELDQHHRVDQPTLITSSIYIHITNTSAPQHWPTLLILCTSYMVVWLSGDVPLKRHNNLDNLLQETKTCFVCAVWMIPDKAAPSIACRSVVRGLGWVSGVQNIVIQFE